MKPAKERAKEIMDQLAGIGGGRSVGFGPNKVRSLPDAVGKAIGMHFGIMGSHDEIPRTKLQETNNNQLPIFQETKGNGHAQTKADLCPSCGEATLAFEEGCKKCYACGYSEC